MTTHPIRLGADVGGTFTDVALNTQNTLISTKVLTDHTSPEQSILDGIQIVIKQAGIRFSDIDSIIHGTTLATNALIEQRGAKTALVTTEGFRDVIEMRTENRFDQYDLNLQLPKPLVPRQHRFPVAGRIDAKGQELQPLDKRRLEALADELDRNGFDSIAIGFIHSYQNPIHEECARDILTSRLPHVPISISAEVSPQMREFERFNTVCANAYVRPQIEDYLTQLQNRLTICGATCPVLVIHSGGGLISIETAIQFPVRLVESGPAGGAIFAADIAARFGLKNVISYDMGGTTAKICLIENCKPQTARTFEVARTYRFCKGSGMPISIPVIEMIEIGAGGGSIAWVDTMDRIQVGPESAASYPGPACYRQGGSRATITDADLVLGKLDPNHFAGGAMSLNAGMSKRAIARDVGDKLSLPSLEAAFGIVEVVDENMANAARIHAVENGKDISDSVMIAFGGAAPLHAARVCEKLGINQCLIPAGAGVGSAIGFLKAPFSYEAVLSRLVRLSNFDLTTVNDILQNLCETAEGFVQDEIIDRHAKIKREIITFMRYRGQGWEIPVVLSDRALTHHDIDVIRERFRKNYAQFFGRTIDSLNELDIEIVTWSVKVSQSQSKPAIHKLLNHGKTSDASNDEILRPIFDPSSNSIRDSRIVERAILSVGDRVIGPAVIVERETSTVVTSLFDAVCQNDGSLCLIRKEC